MRTRTSYLYKAGWNTQEAVREEAEELDGHNHGSVEASTTLVHPIGPSGPFAGLTGGLEVSSLSRISTGVEEQLTSRVVVYK